MKQQGPPLTAACAHGHGERAAPLTSGNPLGGGNEESQEPQSPETRSLLQHTHNRTIARLDNNPEKMFITTCANNIQKHNKLCENAVKASKESIGYE